ncbi:MAG: hypothetical protein GY770_25130, partial [Aestuariibacter sp.]|nr:hypothetical protein [Aestuariibacter sp.]
MPSFFKLLSRLSLKAQYRLAYLLSIPASLIPNRMLRYTRLNLSLCLPEVQAEQHKLLTKMSIRHSCYTFFEIAAVWCGPAQKILSSINSQNVSESFRQSHRGRVLIVPHL